MRPLTFKRVFKIRKIRKIFFSARGYSGY